MFFISRLGGRAGLQTGPASLAPLARGIGIGNITGVKYSYLTTARHASRARSHRRAGPS